MLRLSFLRIDGRAIAMQIAMVTGDAFWLLKIGYDAAYASCSPGVLLLRDAVAAAAREGLESFEFLGQCESWIRVWTSQERETVALHAYPHTPSGAAALAGDAVSMIAKRARRRAASGDGVRGAGRRAAKRAIAPVRDRVAHRYIAGDDLEAAVRVRAALAARRIGATIGFWDGPGDTPQATAAEYAGVLDALRGGAGPADYVSVKFTALGLDAARLRELVAAGTAAGRRIHLDSMGPDAADATRLAVEEVLASVPGAIIGVTLPGRWRRSPADADWACAEGLAVRVVKGEWADPAEPAKDPRAGYLDVVNHLCGRAARVSVATHDPRLAREAVRRLRDAGTPVTLELLYGLPGRDCLRVAEDLDVPVRIYVPYGQAYMPYAMEQLRRRPSMALWLAKDLVRSLADRSA